MQDASFRQMIQNIHIQNFKSIKNLSFEARRVNVFIGEPNTGKSNILEALGLFSLGFSKNLQTIARLRTINDLFHKYDVDSVISVTVDKTKLLLSFANLQVSIVEINEGRNWPNGISPLIEYQLSNEGDVERWGDYNLAKDWLIPPKIYKYKLLDNFEVSKYPFLHPPFGTNLPDILFRNDHLRELVGEIIKEKGFKLNINRGKREIDIVESEENGISLSYPFSSMSDTLQRIIFYLAAIESNKNSALIFEEPESHIFPFYNKYLAELIAQNEAGNQFFIATHNPYFMGSLVFKTPIKDLAVYISYMEDYETKLRLLTNDEIEELASMDTGMFFNLDLFLPQK